MTNFMSNSETFFLPPFSELQRKKFHESTCLKVMQKEGPKYFASEDREGSALGKIHYNWDNQPSLHDLYKNHTSFQWKMFCFPERREKRREIEQKERIREGKRQRERERGERDEYRKKPEFLQRTER